MKYHLPYNYSIRKNNASYTDEIGPFNYQPHVYALADQIASRAGLEWIIDIGCGSAGKLVPFSDKNFSIIGVDTKDGIRLARDAIPNATLIAHDLGKGAPRFPDNILPKALIICSDVIEHVRKPQRLIHDLAKLSRQVPFLLVSTPDRDRARGWLDNGPPINPAHIMEWSGSEFIRFMVDCGFDKTPFYGHTINTDFHRTKSTTLALSGTHANITKSIPLKRVAALIHGYNEADILPEVFQHLAAQGVEVHYFDNWSEDGSWEIATELERTGLITHCERFPDGPTGHYQWHTQLTRTEEYAKTLGADWILHHDADEIRLSPWEDVSLQEAISWVDSIGYNAIDFTVIDFRFLNTNPDIAPPFQQNLINFEFGRRPGHFEQIKGWKNTRDISLADSGGHNVKFEGRKVYPLKFLLKHYPLRNRKQATQKVLEHRLPRYSLENEKYGWHTQYNQFAGAKEVAGWEPENLIPWHPILFNTEYLVERLSGIGLKT